MPSGEFPATPVHASTPSWYPELLASVRVHFSTGRQRALGAANAEAMVACGSIGREILTRHDAEGYGTRVMNRPSAGMRGRRPEAPGFSPRTLKYIRAFAAAWPDREVVLRLVAQLPWVNQQTLKAEAFKPEFIGHLGMHIAAVDDLRAAPDERPTIGLVLCKTKNDVMAEYALRSSMEPIGVAEWQTELIRSIPEELAFSLPSIHELEAEFAAEPWADHEEEPS